MARTPEFEDMKSQEWPDSLSLLRLATAHAWSTYDTLEDLVAETVAAKTDDTDITRSNLIELAGRAYALLRDLRAEGMRQLATWEKEQKETPATSEN